MSGVSIGFRSIFIFLMLVFVPYLSDLRVKTRRSRRGCKRGRRSLPFFGVQLSVALAVEKYICK